MEKLIVANLKMNGVAFEIEHLLNSYCEIKNDNIKIVACLPFPYLHIFKHPYLQLGAQNVSNSQEADITGEVSANMLADMNVSYCIVGHAERRKFYAENTMQCYEKISQLIKNNITPILCVGENIKQREEGLTLKIIKKQVSGALKRLDKNDISKVVIAYEPVWAINNNVVVNIEDINNISLEILKITGKLTKQPLQHVTNKIIYGGAVTEDNAKNILSQNFISGLMVGRLCLSPSKFKKMCENI